MKKLAERGGFEPPYGPFGNLGKCVFIGIFEYCSGNESKGRPYTVVENGGKPQ